MLIFPKSRYRYQCQAVGGLAHGWRVSAQFSLDTNTEEFQLGAVPGLTVLPPHSFEGESCALVRWAPGTVFNKYKHWGGEEILVLEGTFSDENGHYPKGTWMRSPHLSMHHPYSKEGCLI